MITETWRRPVRFEWFDATGLGHPSMVCVIANMEVEVPIKELPIARVKQIDSFDDFKDYRNAPRIEGYRPQATCRYMESSPTPDPWYALVILYAEEA